MIADDVALDRGDGRANIEAGHHAGIVDSRESDHGASEMDRRRGSKGARAPLRPLPAGTERGRAPRVLATAPTGAAPKPRVRHAPCCSQRAPVAPARTTGPASRCSAMPAEHGRDSAPGDATRMRPLARSNCSAAAPSRSVLRRRHNEAKKAQDFVHARACPAPTRALLDWSVLSSLHRPCFLVRTAGQWAA